MQTASGGVVGGGGILPEGEYTATVYEAIKDQRYEDAVQILNYALQDHPRSRAALSLLGYCHYHMAHYANAAQTYELLVSICPDVEEYRMYLAQSLYKAGVYPEATRAAVRVRGEQYAQRMTMLQAIIKYEQDELQLCKSLLDQCLPDDPDVVINGAAVEFKEGKHVAARERYTDAMNALGYQLDLAYNIALCYYNEGNLASALQHVKEITARGNEEHPELNVGSNADGVESRSVGNSLVLQESCLVEAFNLKAAIEYQTKNVEAARAALNDMPPRREQELDPVTLHNQAVVNADSPNASFRKFKFLLANPPFPPETFGNLCLLHIEHQQYDLAADLLAENSHLTFKYLTQELYEFLDASIMVQTSPEVAYHKFDALTTRNIEQLRKLAKTTTDARAAHEPEKAQKALKEYDEAVERYIPVLMAQARIYWERENYPMVERIFRQSAEFAADNETWKLNVAHVFFMQEKDIKFRDAIRYYSPLVKDHSDDILSVPAIVLANLCVSYIMTTQNEEAEELMRRIEKEEERLAYTEPDKQTFHLCIVNLVIGTLYCAKGNFEFGISRIVKSLEPYDRKLNPDTWFYAKRCFLALAENLAKHMLILKDSSMHEILQFLDQADHHGANVMTLVGPQVEFAGADQPDPTRHNVSYEARQLKQLFLRLRE